MHENMKYPCMKMPFSCMKINDISIPENEKIMIAMIFMLQKFSWVIRLYATSSMEFSPMKIFGKKLSFSCMKMTYSCHDFFTHETFCTGIFQMVSADMSNYSYSTLKKKFSAYIIIRIRIKHFKDFVIKRLNHVNR